MRAKRAMVLPDCVFPRYRAVCWAGLSKLAAKATLEAVRLSMFNGTATRKPESLA
jgi:hypothetical protein